MTKVIVHFFRGRRFTLLCPDKHIALQRIAHFLPGDGFPNDHVHHISIRRPGDKTEERPTANTAKHTETPLTDTGGRIEEMSSGERIMATKPEYTPGPWDTGANMAHVEVWPDGWNVPQRIADCGTKLAPESNAEQCANAKLIAAAPDLLEVCKEAICILKQRAPWTDERWYAKAEAAIHKATE
jgi:hypothetical protein